MFFDYMLTDAQKILAARDYVVTSRGIASAIDRNSITVMLLSTTTAGHAAASSVMNSRRVPRASSRGLARHGDCLRF